MRDYLSLKAVCLLAVLTFTPSVTLAGEAGEVLMGGLRKMMSPREWVYYAGGATAVFQALNLRCVQNFTTAEMAAYLQYTAPVNHSDIQAVGAFLRSRQCRSEADADTIRKEFDSGWEYGWQGAAKTLLRIREMSDTDQLEGHILSGESTSASAFDRVAGVIAGARLFELRRERGEIPVRPPREMRTR